MLGSESSTASRATSTGVAKPLIKDMKQAKGRPEKGQAKRWTWKKPCDKPKRNLSAYNFFFQEQRQIILREREQYAAAQASVADKGEIRLGFDTLARTVATRWRNLDPRFLHAYKEMAQRDRLRYQAELAMWTQKRTVETKVEEQRIANESKCDGNAVSTSGKDFAVSIEEQRLSHGQVYRHPDPRHLPITSLPVSPPTREYSKTNDTHPSAWNINSNHFRADEASMLRMPKHVPVPSASKFDPYLSVSSGIIAKSRSGLSHEARNGPQGAVGHVPRLSMPQESQIFVGYPQFQIRNPHFAAQTPAGHMGGHMNSKPDASKVEMYGFSAPHGYAGVFTSNLPGVNNSFRTSSHAMMLSRSNPPPSRQELSMLAPDGPVCDDVKMSATQQDRRNGSDRRPRKQATGLELIIAAAFDEMDSHDLVAYTSAENK